MKINGDFFKWLAFAIRVIKLLIELFGDKDEQEVAKNHEVKVENHEA